jgi:hypothetical protein
VPEFMLLIRNQADHQTSWKPERHLEFVKKCEVYIGELKQAGQLIAAQPLVKEGKLVTGATGTWSESPLARTGKIQVGYYHVRASDMDEAVAIAKRNPEFEYSSTAEVEVRMIKTKEAETGFVYPKS